ncbi:MAG TPA: hypothetical protein VFQ65_03860 [Kofleriaceae bacterium]|nr:hypothetical protein [Kofleriaceae bacterium]
MACARCEKDVATRRGKWCEDCERDYDTWIRRHATDIVWVVLGGGFVLGAAGMALPMLGAGVLAAAGGALAGWATILVSAKLNARRRRRQFLAGDALPRAYLPAPK